MARTPLSATLGARSDNADLDAGLRELVRKLTEKADWIASVTADLTDSIHAELPELASSEEMRRATYESTESNLRLFLEIIRTGADPAEAEPPPAAVEYAREFVRRGVTIDALMRTYHLGQAAFLRHWMSAVRESVADPVERGEALERGATLSFVYINALTRGLVSRYAHERDRWVRSATALRADVVNALLSGASVDVERASTQLGYPLARHHLAFVVWSGGSDAASGSDDLAALERTAADVAERVGESAPLLVPVGSRLVAGWIGAYDELDPARLGGVRLQPDRAGTSRVAVGLPGHGTEGFARSHVEAQRARRVAQLAGSAPGTVTSYATVALSALASADADHAREFVERELGPLARDDDDALRLAGTLRVYLEERSSPTRTAERLGVHANTIANRVRSVEELLGRPIESRVSELLVALRLAPLVRDDS